MSLPNATPGTLQCPPVSPRTFWPQVAAAPELSPGGGGWVSPRCPHGAGLSLTGHLHLGLALQQRSHAVADDAAVEAGVGAVQRGDHVPAGGVSAPRGHPCHCHSPSERLQVLHTLPVYRTRAQSSFSLRSCCRQQCMQVHGHAGWGHPSVPHCHPGTHSHPHWRHIHCAQAGDCHPPAPGAGCDPWPRAGTLEPLS